MFNSILPAPLDPILGLTDFFQKDPRINKINLGIGVYKDELGQTPVLISVKKAEQQLLENEKTKNYLNIDGLSDFSSSVKCLLFNQYHPLVLQDRIKVAQCPGGTGALRVAADFLVQRNLAKRIWISEPGWPNHLGIFTSAGLEVLYYKYYNFNKQQIDFAAMQESLIKTKPGDIVLFHGCCHNPTGMDPTYEQWQSLAKMSEKNGWLPMFDFAYQGFAESIIQDTQGLRIFVDNHDELIIASSFSKNFSLYNERVGACVLVAANKKTVEATFSHIKTSIRTNYSNPPAHGGLIVSTILNNKILRSIWENELLAMRKRIHNIRQLLVKTLEQEGASRDFSFITKQNGMFSLIGLSEEQVVLLKKRFGIYVIDSGRINVAGITLKNISYLCKSLIEVMHKTESL